MYSATMARTKRGKFAMKVPAKHTSQPKPNTPALPADDGSSSINTTTSMEVKEAPITAIPVGNQTISLSQIDATRVVDSASIDTHATVGVNDTSANIGSSTDTKCSKGGADTDAHVTSSADYFASTTVSQKDQNPVLDGGLHLGHIRATASVTKQTALPSAGMAASASVTSAPLNRSTVSGKAKKRQKFAPKLTGGAKVADKAQVTGRPIHVDGKAVPDIDSSTTADAGADLGVSTEKSVLLTVDTTTDKNAHINMGNGVLDGTTGAKVDKPRRKTKFAPKKIATTQRKVVAAMNRSTVVMETEKVITEYSAVRGSGVLAGALTGERMQEVGLGKDANTEKHKESVRADTQVATTTVSNLPYGSETKGAEVTTETIQSIVAPTNPTSTSLNAVESVHEPITVSKGEIAATRTNSNVIENTLNTVDTSTNATVADMTTEVAVTKKAKRSKFAPKKFSARIPAKATVAQPAVVSTVDTTHTQRKTSDAREDTRAALGLLGEGSELESHTRAPLPIDASLRGTGQSGANAEAHAHTSVVHAHDQNERHGLKQAQDKNRIRGDSQASKDMIESVLGAVEVSEKAEWAVDTVLGKAAENSQMVTIDPPGSQEARLDTEDQNLTVSETMARVAQIVAEKRKARKAIDAHNRDEAIASQAMVKLSKAGPVRREVFDMSGPESDYNGRSSMALPPPPTRPTAATARGIEASDMESDVYLTNEFDTQPTAKRVPITQDLDVSECEAAPIAITKRRKLMRKGEPVEGYISKSSSNDDSDSDAPLSLLAENNRRKKPKKKSTYKRKAPSKALTTTKWAKNQITDASDGGLYTDIHTDAGGEDVISIDELKKRALKKVKEKEKKPRKSKQSKTVREVQSDGTVTEVMQIDVAKRSRRPATKTVALVPPTTLMSELVHTNPIANPTKQEHKRRERKKVAVKIKTIEKAQKHIRIRVRSLKAHMEGLRAKEVIDEKELAEEEQTLENLEDEIVEYDHQLVEQRAEFECLAPKEIKRAGAGISRNQITQGAAASQAEVMFDEDGNIVLNEDTLVSHVDDSIPGFNPDQPMDIVYEDDEHVRMSYHSYATWQRADKWTTSDTLAFYDAIKIFGSDFTFIHQKFPKRSRGQIRNKFKREEKTNRELIDKLLAEHVEVSRKLTSAISALPEFGILKDNIRSTDEYHTLKPDDSAFGAFKNDKDANGDLISENRGGVYIPELDMAMLDGF